MTTAADLAVNVTSDVDVSGFKAVDTAAAGAANAVTDLGNDAAKSARQIGISADAADELAGKAGKTTGALGALSSGFELVGAEKYAGALQGAALATDFVSGAGDALNLVMESTAIKTAIATVRNVAHSGVTTALAAKTAVLTGAQAALNLVLSANPIALVVIAAIALVAGLVLLYNKSETFRNIVQSVGRVGKEAFLLITTPTRTLFKLLGDVAAFLKDKFPGAFNVLEKVGGKVKDFLLAPFETVKNIVDDILDLISKIDIPSIGDIKGGGVPFVPGIRAAAGVPLGGDTYEITISGLLDSDEAAEKIQALLDKNARRKGGS